MRRWLTLLCASALLAACGGESHQDLRAWMADQGKNVKGKIVLVHRFAPAADPLGPTTPTRSPGATVKWSPWWAAPRLPG